MLILALDTSSPWTSCALVDPDLGVVAESLHAPPAKAGEILPGALVDLCGGDLSRVDALAVGLGPGSFTGLRVGLAALKAIAYARELPLAGVSSLRALALSAQRADVVVPTLEARRGELYASAVDGGGTVVLPETVMPASSLPAFVERLHGPATVVGPGARANLASLGRLTVLDEPVAPLARSVAQLCAAALRGARHDRAAVFALAPEYLSTPAAEVTLSEGRLGGLPRRPMP